MNKKNKLILSVFLLIIFLLLRYVYNNVVFALFDYYGYKSEYSFKNDLFGTSILLITLSLLLLFKLSDYLYSICFFVVLMSLLPNIIVHIYNDTNYWIVLGSFFLITNLLLLSNFKKNFSIPTINKKYHARLLLCVSFIMIVPIIYTFGFSPNFNIFTLGEEIYDVRLKARTQDNLITGYLSSTIVNIICPITLIIGIKNNSKISVFIPILLMLYMFTCYASKSVFFSIPLLIFFYFGDYFNKLLFTSLSYILLCLFPLFFEVSSQIILFINGLFYNRLVFVPALGINYHFIFFEDKPLFLSGSIFRYFIDYPFDVPVPFVIGQYFFNSIDHAANVGFPADGFINFGVIGIFIFNFIISFVFIIFNNLNIDKKFFGLFVLVIINLLSTYLFTVFFTHGLLLLLLISFLILRNTKHEPE